MIPLALTFISVSAELIGMSPGTAFYMVAVANGASLVGRLTSGAFAVSYGPVNVMIVFSTLAAAFTYAWPFATSNGAFIVITVLYGYVDSPIARSISELAIHRVASGAFNTLFAVVPAQLGDPRDIGRRTGVQMTIMAFGTYA